MRALVFRITLAISVILGGLAHAQAPAWVQIEAQPTLREAEARARAYSEVFADVAGFRLGSGWYAIALGPYPGGDASERLALLRREGLIPSDSFIADGRNFRQQFWPAGPQAAVASAPPAPEAEAAADPEPAPVIFAQSDESPAEARQSEAALSREAREDLQRALQWFGHYAAGIVSSAPPGSTRSISASSS